MKSDMSPMRLSDVCDIISGGTPKTSIREYWDGNIGWLSVNDFGGGKRYVYNSEKKITQKGVDNSATKVLEVGDVIISARGTVGELAQIGNPMAFNQSCFGIRAKKEYATNDYIYYFLRSFVHNLKKKSQGSVFQTINLSTFDFTEVLLPDISVQKNIAKVLSSIDDKIALNNKINTELEQTARMIYDYWFTQFDFPNAHGKPYKSSGGAMVYNDQLKRKIPEGWSAKRLSEVTSRVQSGGTPPTNNAAYYEGEIKWFSTKELEDSYVLDSEKHISIEALNNSSARIFPKGSVLIAIYASPTAGRLGILSDDGAINQAISGIEPSGEFSTEYIFMTLLSTRQRLLALASGTAQKNLSNGIIQDYIVVVPPESVLKDFNGIAGILFKMMRANCQESEKLEELRDWLLPMLMTGQVKVG